MVRTSSLNRLPVGQSARLTRVGGEGSFRRRLMEMGLTPGVEVQLLKRAPMGDPLELQVRGARISIRGSEAQAVTVEPLPARAPGTLRQAFSRTATTEG